MVGLLDEGHIRPGALSRAYSDDMANSDAQNTKIEYQSPGTG